MPYKDKEKKKQYRSEYYQTYKIIHKEEIKRKRRLAYLKNREKVKEQSDRYYREHRDVVLKRNKERHKNNRKHFSEYKKRRMDTEPNYKLRYNISGRIRSAIKAYSKYHNKKSMHTMQLLGCSIEFLKNHLQQTALKNGYFDFNINNYSSKEYHVDHIVPCTVFNLNCKYHQRLCFHWSNLQILEAKENIRKSGNIAA